MLGDPLFVDDNTLQWHRTEFARICVRLNFANKLPKGIWLESKGRKFFQSIFYERLPKICFSCGACGHSEDNCSKMVQPQQDHEVIVPPPVEVATQTIPALVDSDSRQLHPPIPSSSSPHIKCNMVGDSRPSEVMRPLSDPAPSKVPLDDGWFIKRNRKHDAFKPRRKVVNYNVPWRNFLKPKRHNNQQWKVVQPPLGGTLINLNKKPFDLFGESSLEGKDGGTRKRTKEAIAIGTKGVNKANSEEDVHMLQPVVVETSMANLGGTKGPATPMVASLVDNDQFRSGRKKIIAGNSGQILNTVDAHATLGAVDEGGGANMDCDEVAPSNAEDVLVNDCPPSTGMFDALAQVDEETDVLEVVLVPNLSTSCVHTNEAILSDKQVLAGDACGPNGDTSKLVVDGSSFGSKKKKKKKGSLHEGGDTLIDGGDASPSVV